MKYYQAKVKTTLTDNKGNDKKITEVFLIHAVSVTDAETQITTHLESGPDFEVTSVTETKIVDVLSPQ